MTRLRILGLGAAGLAALLGGSALFAARTARKVETALPPRGRFVDLGGQRLHYLDEGAGPPIVMIHGLGGQTAHFTHSLVDRLKSEFRLVVVDRPGSGYSPRDRQAPANVRAQAASIADLIRHLGLDRPLVVGHSLGGAIALALALDHPDCVGGLALIAPLTHPQEQPPAAFKGLVIRSPVVRRIIASTLATPVSIASRDKVLATVFDPDPVPADFGTAGGGMLGLRPDAFYAASTDLVAANDDMADMVARYGTLDVPVAVLFGRDDRILDHRVHGEAMTARNAAFRVEVIEGGHMLPITAPDRSADFIRSAARDVAARGNA
jgi:pimeloyl-ACP methyl ester carboxylesterase